MKQETMTPNDIRRIGLEALRLALGPVRMIEFLQQFETGRGDYTRERQREESRDTVRTLAKKIQRWRNARERAAASTERRRRHTAARPAARRKPATKA